MLKIKNETLMSSNFSQAMSRICSMVWGREADESVFLILDAVTEKQNHLNRLYKKYLTDSGVDPQNPEKGPVEAFNNLWGPIITDSSELKCSRQTLTLKADAELSGMDRFILKELFDIKG